MEEFSFLKMIKEISLIYILSVEYIQCASNPALLMAPFRSSSTAKLPWKPVQKKELAAIMKPAFKFVPRDNNPVDGI